MARSPSLTLSGSGQTLVLTDFLAPDPFPGVQITREYSDRKLRVTGTGAANTMRVFRPYNTANLAISITIPYCDAASYSKLRTMIQGDPPEVQVTYLYLSGTKFDLIDLTPVPDGFWWDVEQSYQVSLSLRGKSQ